MAGLALHLGSQLHEGLFHDLALIHDLIALLVGQVRNFGHLGRGLSLVLIEDAYVVFEVLTEAISSFDWISNGLKCLQTSSLLF